MASSSRRLPPPARGQIDHSDGAVRSQVQTSLDEIGRTHPDLLLAASRDFLKQNTKANKAHRIFLLQLIDRCLATQRERMDETLGISLIELAISEMTLDKALVFEWQGAASKVLASLSLRFPTPIVSELFGRFQPGQIPHYYLLKTLADISVSNPMETVPKVKDILARLLPILSSIKSEELKFVIAFCMTQWCEAILCYIVNLDQAPDKSITHSSFSSEVYPAFEILFNTWLQNAKESQTRLQCVRALGNICALLPAAQFEAQLPRLIPAVLKMYAKEKDHYPITQSLSNILCVAVASEERHRIAEQRIAAGEPADDPDTPSDSLLHSDQVDPSMRSTYVPTRIPTLEPLLITILSTIAPLSAKPVNPNDPTDMRNHNELLRCYEVIGRVYSDPLLTFLFSRIDLNRKENAAPSIRSSTLSILRHLIVSIDSQLESKRGLIVSGLKPLALHEQDYYVKRHISQVIISMADYHYLHLDGGESLVEFLIRGSAITDAEIHRFKIETKKHPVPADRSPEAFRSGCDRIISLLTTNFPQVACVLWPFLFEFFVNPRLSEALAILAKCASTLGTKKRAEWQDRLSQMQPGDPPPPEDLAADAYLINFDRSVNVPRAPALMMRLLVVANEPHRRNQLGLQMLSCLQAIGPIVHHELPQLWDHAIPKLMAYLEAKSEDLSQWNANTWEDLTLRLLAESIKAVGDDEWTLLLGQALSPQFTGYAGHHHLKKVAFKQMGLILQKLNHKEFIKAQLEEIFRSCDHKNEVERQGCAMAFGYCAATHLDMTLEKVQELLKAAPPKKSGFLGFFSSSSSSKTEERVLGATMDEKKTAILSFGYVSAYASTKLVTSRIEINMLSTMKPFLESKKATVDLKDTLIKTIDLIGKAVHPSHLRAPYTLKDRDVLLHHIIRYIALPPKGKSEKPEKSPEKDTSKASSSASPASSPAAVIDILQVRILGLAACTTLCHLLPCLPRPLEAELAKTIIEFVAIPPPRTVTGVKPSPVSIKGKNLSGSASVLPDVLPGVSPAASSSSSSSSSSPSSSSSEINAVDDASAPPAEEESGAVIEPEVKPDEEQKRLTLLFTNLTEALSTVLYMDPTIGCLCRLLGALDPWTRSTVVYHRERSVTIVVALLKKYVELKSKGVMPPPDVVDDKFLHLGPVLSMLIPRCTDSSTRVRVRAVESVQTVLFIDHVLRQNAHSPPNGEAGLDLRPPEALMPMTEFRGQIAQGHLTTQFGTVFEIAGIICQLLLDDDEVANMLLKVFSALNDPELTSAAGTCVVLNAILKLRGQQLAAWLPDLVQGMVGAMGGITEEKTMNGTLHSLRTLATHHLIEVVEVLLRMPLPHTVHVVKSFQVIAQDEYLVGRMVDHFCDILNNSQVILDAGGKHNASVQSQAITAALGEVLMIEDMDCYVQAHPHQFFGTLALRLGTTSNLASGEPRKQCVVAWRELAKRLGSPGLVQLMAEPGRNRWTELGTGEYLDALRGISKAVARDHSAQLPAYYDYIAPYIKGNFFGQRVVTVAVLSEMVPFITNNSTLLHRTVNSLLTSIVEPKLMLSSIRGLGNVSHCGALEANKYAQTIINSLMASVDSADHEIAMASMAGLSSLFEVVDAPCVTPILINICHRIHPHFEGKDPEIRGTAIRLFGTLSRFGADVVSLEVLTDQIHAHLPCLLVHLNESDGLVRDHTRYTLRSMLPLLNNANLSAWVKGPFFEQGSDRPYSEVLPALATGLVQFSDRIHTYIMTLRENYWHSKRGALMCTTAVLIVGNVLAALPVESRRAVNMDIVGGALIKMFQQEKKPETRKAVAYVISLLTEY